MAAQLLPRISGAFFSRRWHGGASSARLQHEIARRRIGLAHQVVQPRRGTLGLPPCQRHLAEPVSSATPDCDLDGLERVGNSKHRQCRLPLPSILALAFAAIKRVAEACSRISAELCRQWHRICFEILF
jgi:hypothetical protein